jgi:PAS domain S-box-containing protein
VRESNQASGATPLVGPDLAAALADAQARYQRLEERFKVLVRATEQLIWVMDSQGMITDMPGWQEFTGASLSDIREGGWIATLHPDDRASVQSAWLVAVRDSAPYLAEYRVRRRDGVYRWFLARGMPIFAADGTIREWIGTSTDITERKLMERELVERAHQLDTTFAAIADGIFVYAMDGSIRMMNPAVRHLFGLAPDDEMFVALSAEARAVFLHLRDEDGQPLPLDQLPTIRLLRGETLATAVSLRTRDGRERVMGVTGAPIRDEQGAIIGGVAVYRDITERRNTELRTMAALNALLEMGQALVQSPQDPAPAIPPRADANPASLNLADLIRRVLGCDRVGLLAIDPQTRIVQPLAVAGLSEAETAKWWDQQRAQQTPMDTTTAEYRALNAGQVLLLDFSQPPYVNTPNPYGIRVILLAPMRLGDELIGMVTLDYGGAEHHYTPDELRLIGALAQLTTLIVEHDRLLREREAAETRAHALQVANARMDGFLHMVNHELKTPLTALRAYIDIAENRTRRQLAQGDPAQQQRLLANLHLVLGQAKEQGLRMTRLLHDLLEASAINTDRFDMHMASLDLAHLTRSMVRQQRLLWPERRISVAAPIRQGGSMVRGDDLRLSQVLTNFLNNALKYAPPEQPIAVRVSTARGMVRVAVTDHGPGLSPDEQAQVWGRFERGAQQESGGGLGLGLYISQAIIAEHGGTIGVESVKGQGATFWFTLPLLQLPSDEKDVMPSATTESEA